MKTVNIVKDKIIIEFSQEELGVINNALNEVCNGIEVWEFDTRMGIKIEDARKILESLNSIYKQSIQLNSDFTEE